MLATPISFVILSYLPVNSAPIIPNASESFPRAGVRPKSQYLLFTADVITSSYINVRVSSTIFNSTLLPSLSSPTAVTSSLIYSWILKTLKTLVAPNINRTIGRINKVSLATSSNFTVNTFLK